MTDLIRKMFGLHVNQDEQRVLDAINGSGLKSMRVVGRGTLTLDPDEVVSSEKFKTYAAQARKIIKTVD